jgi:hypothetical protein
MIFNKIEITRIVWDCNGLCYLAAFGKKIHHYLYKDKDSYYAINDDAVREIYIENNMLNRDEYTQIERHGP